MFDPYSFLKNPQEYPIDIQTYTPDSYDYFEALLDEEGNLYEAPNGHSQGTMYLLAKKLNIPIAALETRCEHLSFWHEWLLKESGVAMIWYNQVISNQLNPKQLEKLRLLQEKGFIAKRLLCMNHGYDGLFNQPERFVLTTQEIKQ